MAVWRKDKVLRCGGITEGYNIKNIANANRLKDSGRIVSIQPDWGMPSSMKRCDTYRSRRRAAEAKLRGQGTHGIIHVTTTVDLSTTAVLHHVAAIV